MGLAALIFPADWAGLDQHAGLVRNAETVANAERLVSFWDGASPGTANLVLQTAGRRNTWPQWYISARRTGFARRSRKKLMNFRLAFGRFENIP